MCIAEIYSFLEWDDQRSEFILRRTLDNRMISIGFNHRDLSDSYWCRSEIRVKRQTCFWITNYTIPTRYIYSSGLNYRYGFAN